MSPPALRILRREPALAERKSANSAIAPLGLCAAADLVPSRTLCRGGLYAVAVADRPSLLAARRSARAAAAQPLSAADLSIQACFSSPVAMPMSKSLLRWSTSSTGSRVDLIRSETVISSSSNCE